MRQFTVGALMTPADLVVTVRPDTPFKEAAAALAAHRVSGVPVLGRSGRVLGVVSEADLLPKEIRIRANGPVAVRRPDDTLGHTPETCLTSVCNGIVSVRGRVPTRSAARLVRATVDRAMPLHLVNALGLPPGGSGVLLPGSYAEAGRAASGVLLHQFAKAVADRYPALAVTTEVPDLGAAETLVALGGEGDLVVTGTRGHGGSTGLLLGSVSLKTAAHARCPAVVVRG